MPTRCKQLGLKDFSPKSQDAGALQQIKERMLYLWLTVVISVRQSTVAAISGPHWAGRYYGQFEHKADSLIAKFKEAGGTSERLMYEQSRHDYLRSGLSASSSACHGLLIRYRDNAINAPARQKCQRNWSWRTRQLLTCRCVSASVAASDAKYTKELADVKAEMMLCVMMLPLVVVGWHIKAVCQPRVKPPRSGVDNAASRLADTAERDYLRSPERGWSLCKKQLPKGTQKYINEQCR